MSDEKSGIERVVGLKYEKGVGLPQVILKGSGKVAGEMLDQAKKKRGPKIVKDEKLLAQLYRLPIDGEIGPELFQLVAVLLVHVFSVQGSIGEESK